MGRERLVWLSYDFVRRWAVEAWFLGDAPAFLAQGADAQWKMKGGARVWSNGEYVVAYKGSGTISITSAAGIAITNSGKGETLNVSKSNALDTASALCVSPIPAITIQTTENFKKIQPRSRARRRRARDLGWIGNPLGHECRNISCFRVIAQGHPDDGHR